MKLIILASKKNIYWVRTGKLNKLFLKFEEEREKILLRYEGSSFG